jgi:hypothetical protein
MLKPQERLALRRRIRSLNIMWGFFMAALPVYISESHLLGGKVAYMDFSHTTILVIKIVLAIFAFWALVNAYYWKTAVLAAWRRGPKPGLIRQMFTLRTMVPISSRDAAAKYTSITMISITLSESVGIYGLVLFMITGEFITLYVFVAVSAVALYFFRPRFSELEGLIIQLKQHLDSKEGIKIEPRPIDKEKLKRISRIRRIALAATASWMLFIIVMMAIFLKWSSWREALIFGVVVFGLSMVSLYLGLRRSQTTRQNQDQDS